MSLTNEDKDWLETTIRLATTEVATKLERATSELKALIEDVKTELKARIEDVKTELSARIEHVETEMSARIEHVETALLIEFHKWASPNDAKMRTHREALRALDLQIEEIGGRVARLEAAQGWTPLR